MLLGVSIRVVVAVTLQRHANLPQCHGAKMRKIKFHLRCLCDALQAAKRAQLGYAGEPEMWGGAVRWHRVTANFGFTARRTPTRNGQRPATPHCSPRDVQALLAWKMAVIALHVCHQQQLLSAPSPSKRHTRHRPSHHHQPWAPNPAGPGR